MTALTTHFRALRHQLELISTGVPWDDNIAYSRAGCYRRRALPSPPPPRSSAMRVLKLWIIAAILAGAVLAILAITETIPGDDMPRLAWMAFGVLLVLAATHIAIEMQRGGHSAPRDDSDKPVP